jgi:hypothetical protein
MAVLSNGIPTFYCDSGWKGIIGNTKPRGKKKRPIVDVTSTALGNDEMAVSE